MSLELYAAYVLACIVIILVPGPTVTLIIANSIRHGARAGLANVAGTQAGLAVMIAIVGIGLNTLISGMGHWFEWVRLIGAAYLIWMGVQMFRAKGTLNADGTARKPRGGFFLQGLAVALSNPKTLVFFGAFFPQFIAPQGNYTLQIVVMGLTAMIFAAVSDSTYALAASRAGRLLSASRIKLMSRISGSFLVGGGLWLAFSKAK
ncbi:LysE family translocator [Mesorhizobium caraganae]|uniref:LysE family translocator n=1 Tax=Mesorhizobium caraganae TaxID=483206 RepID=A0ABV1Z2X3_9HYPH